MLIACFHVCTCVWCQGGAQHLLFEAAPCLECHIPSVHKHHSTHNTHKTHTQQDMADVERLLAEGALRMECRSAAAQHEGGVHDMLAFEKKPW